MKIYHFAIVFVFIAITLLVMTDVKTNNYIAVAKEKEYIDQSFNQAVNDAVKNLVEIDGIDNMVVNRKRAVNNFFLSLYSNLDFIDKPEKQEMIDNYVPVIAVTYEDGYYIYYSDEYKGSDNYTYIKKRWSEKLPYSYEDDDFIYGFTLTDKLTIYDKKGLLDTSGEQKTFTLNYQELLEDDDYSSFRTRRPGSFLLNVNSFYLTRKGCIINNLEKSMSYYCNKHNSIAEQYGITYKFAMPVVDNSEWERSIDNPSIIVIFQGYPYGSGVGETYNRFTIAGSQINKNTVYYLEQKNWYYVYHKADCGELNKVGMIFSDEPYYTIQECVKKGAYACSICQPSGVHAPDYEP